MNRLLLLLSFFFLNTAFVWPFAPWHSKPHQLPRWVQKAIPTISSLAVGERMPGKEGLIFNRAHMMTPEGTKIFERSVSRNSYLTYVYPVFDDAIYVMRYWGDFDTVKYLLSVTKESETRKITIVNVRGSNSLDNIQEEDVLALLGFLPSHQLCLPHEDSKIDYTCRNYERVNVVHEVIEMPDRVNVGANPNYYPNDFVYEKPPVVVQEQIVYEYPVYEPVYEYPVYEPVYEYPVYEPVYEYPVYEPVYEYPVYEPVYEVYEPVYDYPVYEYPVYDPVLEYPVYDPVYENHPNDYDHGKYGSRLVQEEAVCGTKNRREYYHY